MSGFGIMMVVIMFVIFCAIIVLTLSLRSSNDSLERSQMTYAEVKHLEWVYQRMIKKHKEHRNYDYMCRFKEIIGKLKELQCLDSE